MTEGQPRSEAGRVGGPGLIEADRDRATLTFRRLLPHPIDTVWEAITDPEQIERWFLAKVRRDAAPGGRLEMEHPNGVRASGRVLAWDPPRLYEYEWDVSPGPRSPVGEASVVRWELSPTRGGTLLVMTHRRLTRARAEVFVRGLPVLLDRLAASLAGDPMPDPPWARAA